VGGFDNGVPEDRDWCRRARLKGYRIGFAPNSIVGHPARRTMTELKRKWRRLTLEWCEGARRDRRGAIFMLLHAWAVVFSIGPHALAVMSSNRLSGTRNRIMAIGALARIRAYRFVVAHRAVLRLPER
jgi:GT2 family glycosyltransferase